MDNNTRRQLLDRHRRSGFPGSIIDVYKAYDQGIDLIGQFEQQQMLQKQNIDVASTPQEVQQGLRPAHAAGDVNKSMLFPNIPPNTPFTTVGMKAPINIQKFDNQGHLVKSYENVPPGIKNLPMGPHQGTVLETPAQMKNGGMKKYQSAGLPTYADSTNVANFARAAQDFYNDPNNKYRLVSEYTPEEYTNLSWSDFVKYLHKKTDAFNHAHPSSWNVDIKRINNAFNTNITADAFIRDVSNPYQVSPPDVLNGNYNSFFNPNAPDPIFDSRIVPESVIYYKDGDDATDIPSYDPIMVTPWQDLTEDEKKERVDKGIRTGNTGGIPWSVIQTSRHTGIVPSGQPIMHKTTTQKDPYTGSSTGLFIDALFEMPSLPPSQIPVEALEERGLIPMMKAKSGRRESQTIYKQDPRVSTGQYPVGERIWDDDKKRWVERMWDKEMQRDSRELARPRRERWRTIETPPGGFMNGGVRKAQAGLPPFSLQPTVSESTYQPNYGEQAFLNQMAAGPREERVLDIGPTISQGNFEVDENNKIIEDRPSYLEMAANPMATARAILNPAVEGLPSQVEFDQSVGRGNTLGVMANDVVNPAAWANYGINAARNFGQAANYAIQGEGQKAFQAFGSGTMNALSAVPGMTLSGSATAAAGKQALNATVGQGIRNVAYNMVSPFGYNPRFLTPKEIIRNVLNPAGRPTYHIGFENTKYPEAASGAARRLDALAIGLGKKPRYNTFRQIGDNTYEPINGAVDVQDILETTKDVLNRRLAATGELGERGSTIGLNDGTFKTMGGYHLVDEAVPDNPMLRRIIMNDKWDLHPFQDEGVEHFANSYPVTKKIWNALPTRAQNYISNKFRNLEVFDALGGKPINIQSRWTAEMAPDWATNKNVGDILLTNDATGRSFNSYLLNNSPHNYEMLSLFDKPNYKTGGVRKAQAGIPPIIGKASSKQKKRFNTKKFEGIKKYFK